MLHQMFNQCIQRVVCAALLALPAILPGAAWATPETRFEGATVGEWSAKWWQWALLIPKSRNPMLDHSGANCAENQKGPVWFLGAYWGHGGATRNCTIPAGKSIFFPIANYMWVQSATDVYNPPLTETDYRQCVAGVAGNRANCAGLAPISGFVDILRATLNGVPLATQIQTPIVRAQSPLFRVRGWPADNVFGADPAVFEGGRNGEMVSDGYWGMLPPLKPGKHVLVFCAMDRTATWQEYTYNLIVAKGKEEGD